MPAILAYEDPGLPAIIHGGLMDVSIHPNYPTSPWVYLSYLDTDSFATVARFQIQDKAAIQFEIIFRTRSSSDYGNGMRIVWEDDAHFFLNIGGSTLTTNTNPVFVSQDLEEDWGKIHRLKEDGSIPLDNPVFDGLTSPTSIWSYGHRDSQGLYFDKSSDTLFGLEHGPKGGDEFNVIEKGGNYGWPLFTYGVNYDGAEVSTISEDEAAASTILPEHYWTVPTDYGGQAVAPAGLLKVDGSNISDWNNHFLFGSLAFRRLMKYNHETNETFGLNIEGRVRTIKQLPSGDIIALIERNDLNLSNGKIVRISE